MQARRQQLGLSCSADNVCQRKAAAAGSDQCNAPCPLDGPDNSCSLVGSSLVLAKTAWLTGGGGGRHHSLEHSIHHLGYRGRRATLHTSRASWGWGFTRRLRRRCYSLRLCNAAAAGTGTNCAALPSGFVHPPGARDRGQWVPPPGSPAPRPLGSPSAVVQQHTGVGFSRVPPPVVCGGWNTAM